MKEIEVEQSATELNVERSGKWPVKITATWDDYPNGAKVFIEVSIAGMFSFCFYLGKKK